MVSVNSIILAGHLGAAPEERRTATGKLACAFRMATNRWDSRAQEEVAEWHSVVCYEKQAEYCVKYLQKGAAVLVEGRLSARTYEAADGKKSTWHEVIANRVTFLGGRGDKAEPLVDAAPSTPQRHERHSFNADAVPF